MGQAERDTKDVAFTVLLVGTGRLSDQLYETLQSAGGMDVERASADVATAAYKAVVPDLCVMTSDVLVSRGRDALVRLIDGRVDSVFPVVLVGEERRSLTDKLRPGSLVTFSPALPLTELAEQIRNVRTQAELRDAAAVEKNSTKLGEPLRVPSENGSRIPAHRPEPRITGIETTPVSAEIVTHGRSPQAPLAASNTDSADSEIVGLEAAAIDLANRLDIEALFDPESVIPGPSERKSFRSPFESMKPIAAAGNFDLFEQSPRLPSPVRPTDGTSVEQPAPPLCKSYPPDSAVFIETENEPYQLPSQFDKLRDYLSFWAAWLSQSIKRPFNSAICLASANHRFSFNQIKTVWIRGARRTDDICEEIPGEPPIETARQKTAFDKISGIFLSLSGRGATVGSWKSMVLSRTNLIVFGSILVFVVLVVLSLAITTRRPSDPTDKKIATRPNQTAAARATIGSTSPVQTATAPDHSWKVEPTESTSVRDTMTRDTPVEENTGKISTPFGGVGTQREKDAKKRELAKGLTKANELIRQGDQRFKENRLGVAEAYYLKALKVKPDYPLAMASLVRVHLQRQDGNEAIRWAQRLVTLQPTEANKKRLADASKLNKKNPLKPRPAATVSASKKSTPDTLRRADF